ncbi:MAG: molybdopterin-binding protein [Sulfolobales archaeon]
MNKRRAWVFTLGTEVVRGLVINTNAAFLGRRLSQLGFTVEGVISLIDDKELASRFLKYVLSEYKPELIVTTGGLGPTHDDITLEVMAEALSRPLVLNNEALEMLKEKLASKGYELTKERIKMAYMPEGATPLPNSVGTAPGALIKHENTTIVCLPGVPREMEEMWTHVENIIRDTIEVFMAEGSFVSVGVPEAVLAPVLRRVYETHSSAYIKSHPRGYELSDPIVEIYVSVTSTSEASARAIVKEVCNRLVEEVVRLGGSIRDFRCPP